MKEDWTNDIRRRMKDHEATPPEGLWQRLEAQLPQAVPPRHRARRLPLYASVAAAATLAGLVVLLMPPQEASEREVPAVSRRQAVTTASEAVANVPIAAVAANKRAAGGERLLAAAAPTTADATTLTAAMADATALTETSDRKEGESTPPVATDARAKARTMARTQAAASGGSRPLLATATATASAPTPHRRLSATLYTGGGMTQSRERGMTRSLALGNAVAGTTDWADAPMLGLLTFNQGQDVRHEVRHKMPLRTGISIAYGLTDRWAIETGLAYTYLAAYLYEGTANNHYTGHQRLHYVGVPLRIKYRALSWQGFSAYAAAGLRLDKRVGATQTKTYVIDGRSYGSDKTRLGTRTLQLTADAALGVSYSFTPAVAIYAEPAVGYRFDDRSAVETVYDKRVLTFDISVGLRFNLGR